MEKFSPVWNKLICFGFMLLKIELSNGTVNIPNAGTPYIDHSFTIKCDITPFSGTANWAKDGTTQATCGTSFCAPNTLGNYAFSYDASGISVTINTVSISDGGSWQCTHSSGSDSLTITPITKSLKSEMRTSMATEGMTSINRVSELRNITLPIMSGSTTTTSIETSNFDANTQNNEIQTNTLRIISNSVSTYPSMFVTTTGTDISGSCEIHIQTMTETFTMTDYTISSYNEITSPSTYETSNVLPQFVPETAISLSVDTLSDGLIHTLLISSGSLIAIDSSEFSILSMTISPSYVGDSNIHSVSTRFYDPSLTSDTTDSDFEITNVSRVSNFSLTTETLITHKTTAPVDSSAGNTVLNSKKSASLPLSISENKSRIQQIETNKESSLISSTFIDQISFSSKIEEPSSSSYQDLSETSMKLSKISVSSQLSSSIIDTMDHFMNTTNTLITSYLDDTRHSFVNFTNVVQSLSQDNAASASTSLPYFNQSTYHALLQATEHYATTQTEFTSHVTTSFFETNTDNAATGIYSKEIVTLGKSYIHTSNMPSQTQLTSINNIQDSTINFQSTYFELYSQANDEFFTSAISKYLLSTLLSTSLLLSFNTRTNVYASYMETTNIMTFESQSGIQTKDLTLLTNPSSIQISTVSFDFKPTLLTTAISFNSLTMLSMIKPSSQRTNSDNSYNEIDSSLKDVSLFINSFSKSITSKDQNMTTLSSVVYQTISSSSTSTIKSRLSEKNKTIIFLSTTSAVVIVISVILLIIFGKMYMSKNKVKICKEDDYISWKNPNCSPKTSFPEFSFISGNIHPILNTASYEKNWNGIV